MEVALKKDSFFKKAGKTLVGVGLVALLTSPFTVPAVPFVHGVMDGRSGNYVKPSTSLPSERASGFFHRAGEGYNVLYVCGALVGVGTGLVDKSAERSALSSGNGSAALEALTK